MTAPPVTMSTPHDATPEAALTAVRGHAGLLLLDLDETLYLRNSTEDFIDSVRPRLLVWCLMRLVELLRPWQFSGGPVTRDVWRVRLLSALMPWSAGCWRRSVAGLAQAHLNRPLLEAVHAAGSDAVVTTAGFHSIVDPLVRAMGLTEIRVLAVRDPGFSDRLAGKLQRLHDVLGQPAVAQALVLTDSIDDIALLDACARPLRTVWPEAGFVPAHRSVYRPGQYLTRVKRVGERYIVRAILQEDLAFWILASVALAVSPLRHVLGLLLLAFSFWTIYERGYVDNDQAAVRFESKPKLSATFRAVRVATPAVQPWLWAAGSGALAIWLLRWPNAPLPADGLIWAAVLAATLLWFHRYNRMDKQSRVWMFLGLQFARGAAFVSLVPILPVGAVALGAHILAKWVPYCLYRCIDAKQQRDWPDIPVHLTRLMFLLVLAALLALSAGPAALWNGSAAAILLWSLFRARQELLAMWRQAHRIDRRQSDDR